MAKLTPPYKPALLHFYLLIYDQSIMPMRLAGNLEKQSSCDKQKRFVESREKTG